MKRKLMVAAVAVALMTPVHPIQAQTAEIMYFYAYYENGQEVGGAQDICDSVTGYMARRQLTWGYATEDFRAIPWYTCWIGGIGGVNG